MDKSPHRGRWLSARTAFTLFALAISVLLACLYGVGWYKAQDRIARDKRVNDLKADFESRVSRKTTASQGSTVAEVKAWFDSHGLPYTQTTTSDGKQVRIDSDLPDDWRGDNGKINIDAAFDDDGRLILYRIFRYTFRF